MPLFSSKFSPKKIPPRKLSTFYEINSKRKAFDDEQLIHLQLSDNSLVFQNGQWVDESNDDRQLSLKCQKLQEKFDELQEENNLLQLKLAITLDMVG